MIARGGKRREFASEIASQADGSRSHPDSAPSGRLSPDRAARHTTSTVRESSDDALSVGTNRLLALTLVGGSTLAVLGLGALRMKLVALAAGPTGVGALGAGLAAASTLATLLGLGLGISGISAIAKSKQGSERDELLSALATASRILAGLGGVIAGIGWIAAGAGTLDQRLIFASALAVAVGSSIAACRSSVTLNGDQRFRRLASAQFTAALSSTVTVAVVAPVSPTLAVVAALAVPPLALVVSLRIAAGARTRPDQHSSIGRQWGTLRPLIGTGMAASFGALLMSASQLIASFWILRLHGSDTNGYFQAAWMLASLYPAFLLATMTAEYLPRIAKFTSDSADLHWAIDSQVRLSLRLLIALATTTATFAPAILSILYSHEFIIASDLLRWFLLGEAFKAAAWPLSFLLLAQNARRQYIASEAVWTVAFLSLTLLLAPFGATWVGVAYSVANASFFIQLAVRTKYHPSRPVLASIPLGTLAIAAGAAPLGTHTPHTSIPGAILSGCLITWAAIGLIKEKRARGS